jgi:hypothetical protein
MVFGTSGWLLVAAGHALLWGSTAAAQPPSSSLEDLERLAPARVVLTDRQDREVRGTIVDASESALSLRVAGVVRQFPIDEIRSVRLTRPDSRNNGTLIGAAVGGGLTSLIFLDNECRDDPVCYQTVAVYAGIGAVVGFLVDTLIQQEVVVYRGRSAAGPVVAVSPIARRRGTGVRLTVAF